MRYYYYPLCSNDYVFENIFASESVSPISFYSKRGFGIDYFYQIPKVHNEAAIILFNEPPKYDIGVLNTDAVKFILEISEDSIDLNEIILINKGIIAYPKTIYLKKNKFNVLFFSEKDKRVTCLKSETSLPTKGLKKFENNLKIISEDKCKDFDLSTLHSIKIEDSIINTEIEFDRKFNSFKGYIYGVATGVICAKSKEQIDLKRSFQEITNSFAELKNRYENNLKSSETKFSKGNSFYQTSLDIYEKRLKNAIQFGEKLFTNTFPSQSFSDETLAVFLQRKYNKHIKNLDDARKYIEYKILDDEIFGTSSFSKLKSHYLRNSGEENPSLYFDSLKQYSDLFSNSMKFGGINSRNNKEELNDNFKDTLFKLGRFVDREFLKNTNKRNVNLENIEYNFKNNSISIKHNFQTLSDDEIAELVLISNAILRSPKFGRGEVKKDKILSIVEQIGNIASKSKGGKKTKLYQYLNNEISTYSIDEVSSIVMKNFVAFIFNLDSLEKLQNFIETKDIDQEWMSYSFWCAFNGFANISRNFVKPIFDTNNELLQNTIDNFLLKTFLQVNSESYYRTEFERELNSNQNIELSKEVNLDNIRAKNREFFDKYILDQYKISFDDFEFIIQNEDKEFIIKELKDKAKMTKKDSKKLIEVHKEFLSSFILF